MIPFLLRISAAPGGTVALAAAPVGLRGSSPWLFSGLPIYSSVSRGWQPRFASSAGSGFGRTPIFGASGWARPSPSCYEGLVFAMAGSVPAFGGLCAVAAAVGCQIWSFSAGSGSAASWLSVRYVVASTWSWRDDFVGGVRVSGAVLRVCVWCWEVFRAKACRILPVGGVGVRGHRVTSLEAPPWSPPPAHPRFQLFG